MHARLGPALSDREPRRRRLPCPTASGIPGLRFDNVREHSLAWIWNESESFNRFRGTEWMPEPCRACPQREIDFGGCRCQAALLTGDAAATDPVCTLSPTGRPSTISSRASRAMIENCRPGNRATSAESAATM